ncbi:MAG: hypothetical protein ACK4N5_10880, partial [Myxococcales bacterium]
AFLRTTFGMLTLGLLLAGGAVWIAAQGSAVSGVLAAVLAVALAGAAGVFLAIKRAIGRALLHGLRQLRLGERTLEVVFSQLLGVEERLAMGARGGAIARTVENLPLAEAESRLKATLGALFEASAGKPGLRGRLLAAIQRSLLEKVEELTLARFREQHQREGGVDLVRVRDELSGRIDALVEDKVQGALNRVTAMVVLGTGAAALLGALAIRQLPLGG